jgi:hypothetical protein
MTERSVRASVSAGLLALCAALPAADAAPAVPAATVEPRVPAGKCTSAAGTLLSRAAPDRPWRVAEAVQTRDQLLALPGVKATVEPPGEGVGLTLWGNLPQLSQYPVLESEVVLHDSRAYDLDLTLERGRVVLTNKKAKGAARVWVRFRGEGWEVTLDEPGDAVALEIYGRWPRGVPFRKEAPPGERPTSVLVLHALKGDVGVKTSTQELALKAAPGPAYFHWDSVAGDERGPQRRDKPPAWADPSAEVPDDAKIIQDILAKYQNLLKTKDADGALLALLVAAERDEDKARASLTREFGVLGLMALDDLVQVADALADPNRPEVRNTAVLALRHWIGEAPGRDQEVYETLLREFAYKPGQAEAVLQLLHSPFDPDQPETYETLIAYLQNPQIAVRELARFHLYRLAPQGSAIAYDAGAPEADRAKAVEEWKKLIPDGKLPPKEKGR